MSGTEGHRRAAGRPTKLERRAFLLALGALAPWLVACASGSGREALPPQDTVSGSGSGDLLDVIESRRSIRAFASTPVSREQVAVMLRATQGVTDRDLGFRAAPSAGALYPLEVYVATAEAVDRYDPNRDELESVEADDVRRALAAASLQQSFIADAPVVFVITGAYERTAIKYGERAPRYVHLEAGHAAQNLLLTAVRLGLGAVPVGAFTDDEVRAVIGAPMEETPLYVIPVGRPSSEES